MFITYNDLNDMRDTRKRSQINAFVNRSRKAIKVKSAQRQARAVQWQSQRATPSTATVKIKSEASTPGTDVIDFGNPHISKDLIFALLKKQRLPPLALQYGLGGLRRDPFASFPVPQTDQIEWAADFFTQNFSAMNASLYTDKAGNWLMKTLFPLALQSDMLFESLLLSMARYSQPTGKYAIAPGSVHFVQLRSSVLTKLHQTLSMEKNVSTSDATIHTFFAGHDDNAAAHLRGLQTLVSLRGGLEHGNFDHYTKFNLAGTQALCQFAEQRLKESGPFPVTDEPELDYPSHPFSPQLCVEIAALPRGLSDIALDGRISIQIIEVFCQISRLTRQSPSTQNVTTEDIYSSSIDVMNFISRNKLSELERSLCLLTFIFIVRETPSRNESQQLYGDFLTTLRRRYQELSKSFMALDGVKADIAIWGVAMFALDNSGERFGLEDNERSELFQELLRYHPTAANWKHTRNSLKRFFFIDSWLDEYRTWWNKQMEKHKKLPRSSR